MYIFFAFFVFEVTESVFGVNICIQNYSTSLDNFALLVVNLEIDLEPDLRVTKAK